MTKFHLIHATAEDVTACSLRLRGSRGSRLDRRKYRRPTVVGIGQFERYSPDARCALCQADLNEWRDVCTRVGQFITRPRKRPRARTLGKGP